MKDPIKQRPFIKSLIALTLSALLLGCGDGKALKFRQSNSALGDGAELAYCNSFSLNSISLSGALMLYQDAYGNDDGSKLNLKLSQVPSDFWTSDRTIAFHKWYPTGASKTTEAIEFSLEYLDSSNQIQSIGGGNLVRLTKASIEELLTLSNMSLTAEQFLDRARIVLHDVDHSWKAVKISYYEGTTGVATKSALMPPFVAHPSIYATNHEDILNEIHPMINNIQNGWIGDDYAYALHNYCF